MNSLFSEQKVETASPLSQPGSGIPASVFLLALTILAVTTSEFMVAGMMPSLAAAFQVSVGQIGYLISLFALGMAIGGPIATALLLHLCVPNKQGLLWLLGLFLAGSLLAALVEGYAMMATARIIQGAASAGCFGIAMTICAELVSPDLRGRAVSYVLAGLMLAPVLGVPVTTLIGGVAGWRASFWGIVILGTVCVVAVARGIPASRSDAPVDLKANAAALASGRLWMVYLTSGLIIGATFSAFSYFSPIFTEVAGLSPGAIPIVLAGYGVANVVGNLAIGRFADRFTIAVLVVGLTTLAIALAVFALFATRPGISIAAFLVIGLVGVSMNPAMVARVMRTAHPGPLVNSLHASVITAGLAFGTWAGGIAIDRGYGLTAPLWVGVILALLGLLSLAPERFRQSVRSDHGPHGPA